MGLWDVPLLKLFLLPSKGGGALLVTLEAFNGRSFVGSFSLNAFAFVSIRSKEASLGRLPEVVVMQSALGPSALLLLLLYPL